MKYSDAQAKAMCATAQTPAWLDPPRLVFSRFLILRSLISTFFIWFPSSFFFPLPALVSLRRRLFSASQPGSLPLPPYFHSPLLFLFIVSIPPFFHPLISPFQLYSLRPPLFCAAAL